MSDLLVERPFYHLRGTCAYDFAMRLLGGMWFLALAVTMAMPRQATGTPAHRLATYCLALFYLILCVLLLTRPPAKAQAYGILPRLAAFVGTYMPWTISFFPHSSDSALLDALSSVCLLVGMVLMLVTVMCLGRAFSLIPQARTVVRTGPYRWLRHPLYLAEEIAVLGALLLVLSLITVLIFVAHIMVQVCRIVYEERLLRQTFPAYRDYAATSWRLIPFVW